MRDITIHRDKYTEAETSRTVTATYFAALAGSRYLRIESPDEQPPSAYTGELTLVSPSLRENFQSKVLNAREEQFDAEFYPVMLDAQDYKDSLKVFGGIFGLSGCWPYSM